MCYSHCQVEAEDLAKGQTTCSWMMCKTVCHGGCIAGHGYDNNQCAEFCVTSHHFLVNGQEHMLNFTEAGKPWGCADKVPLPLPNSLSAHSRLFRLSQI